MLRKHYKFIGWITRVKIWLQVETHYTTEKLIIYGSTKVKIDCMYLHSYEFVYTGVAFPPQHMFILLMFMKTRLVNTATWPGLQPGLCLCHISLRRQENIFTGLSHIQRYQRPAKKFNVSSVFFPALVEQTFLYITTFVGLVV